MSMDAVFRALADPVRRALLDSLFVRNGQTLGELCQGHAMSRQAVTKHLAILESANLVATEKRGREKLHYLNAVPIQEIADRWIGKYERGRLAALADLKHRLEGATPMASRFLYVTFIRAPAERIWAALTDPEQNKLFWGGYHQQSGWKVGDDYKIAGPDGKIWDEGKVLACDPPRRLKVSWLHLADAAMKAEGESVATFELEETPGGVTKLTVTHESEAPNSKLIEAVSGGWPMILASLKSLMETGKALG